MREVLGRAATGFATGASGGLVIENMVTALPQSGPFLVLFPLAVGILSGALFAVSRGSRR